MDGNYAIYGIGEDGKKTKIGSFSIKGGVVSKSTSDIVPEGKLDAHTKATIERYIQDNHGYTHIEKV